MHIQEPEYLWLGKSNGVQHSSRLEVAIFSKFDHHLHAERPLSVCMPHRQPKVAIQMLPHGSHRTIGNNGQPRMNIHAERQTFPVFAIGGHALVDEANPVNLIALEQWFAYRHARPDLNRTGACNPIADPLIELPERENHPAMLIHE